MRIPVVLDTHKRTTCDPRPEHSSACCAASLIGPIMNAGAVVLNKCLCVVCGMRLCTRYCPLLLASLGRHASLVHFNSTACWWRLLWVRMLVACRALWSVHNVEAVGCACQSCLAAHLRKRHSDERLATDSQRTHTLLSLCAPV